ncbi:unnamed protein product [Amoebophrya sp. A120]|nr:unnamed protein product [Amoebophrya sp. A120]|eukprot:GSA120T00005342001.1
MNKSNSRPSRTVFSTDPSERTPMSPHGLAPGTAPTTAQIARQTKFGWFLVVWGFGLDLILLVLLPLLGIFQPFELVIPFCVPDNTNLATLLAIYLFLLCGVIRGCCGWCMLQEVNDPNSVDVGSKKAWYTLCLLTMFVEIVLNGHIIYAQTQHVPQPLKGDFDMNYTKKPGGLVWSSNATSNVTADHFESTSPTAGDATVARMLGYSASEAAMPILLCAVTSGAMLKAVAFKKSRNMKFNRVVKASSFKTDCMKYL